MGNNPSVRQFKTDMQDLVKRAKQDLHATLIAQANEVADNMRAAAPVRTGKLRQSIRVRDVSTSDESKLSVLVIGGGSLTTKKEKSGPHDYSLSTEFGTVKEQPEPFFFNTFRLYQQHGLDQFRETLEQTIEENNQVRALRSSNYSNSGLTASAGHSGAIVINKGKR